MRVSAKRTQVAKLPEKDAPEPKAASEERLLRPGQCRSHMRKILAKEFPEIVQGFVKEAKSGSCQHVKLATELLASKPRARKPRPGSRIFDQWAEELEKVSKAS